MENYSLAPLQREQRDGVISNARMFWFLDSNGLALFPDASFSPFCLHSGTQQWKGIANTTWYQPGCCGCSYATTRRYMLMAATLAATLATPLARRFAIMPIDGAQLLKGSIILVCRNTRTTFTADESKPSLQQSETMIRASLHVPQAGSLGGDYKKHGVGATSVLPAHAQVAWWDRSIAT